MENPLEKQLLAATEIIEQQVDAKLEEFDDIEDYRKKRFESLKRIKVQKEEWLKLGHGTYEEVTSEREFFDLCKKSKNVVCHFYRSSTFYCKVFDKHLSLLAPKHIEARFIRIDAEKSPFLAERLRIRIMPTICLIKDGKSVDFIVGLDDLGGREDFSTEIMGCRIAKAGIIDYKEDLETLLGENKTSKINRTTKSIRSQNRDDSSSDDE